MVSSICLYRTGTYRGNQSSFLRIFSFILSFQLDGEEEQGSIFDDEVDFYGQVHLPI